MTQIALPLSADLPRNDYLITDCNAEAAAQLERWSYWPYRSAVLFGATGAGKTSMGKVFARASSGIFVDDAQTLDADSVFHQWNRAQQEERPILIAFAEDFALGSITLPDLQSRLAASQHLVIPPPDKAMIVALFEKLGMAHGLDITPKLASYAGSRCERSYHAVQQLVAALDRTTLEQRKPVGMAMMRTLLDVSEADSHDEAGAT